MCSRPTGRQSEPACRLARALVPPKTRSDPGTPVVGRPRRSSIRTCVDDNALTDPARPTGRTRGRGSRGRSRRAGRAGRSLLEWIGHLQRVVDRNHLGGTSRHDQCPPDSPGQIGLLLRSSRRNGGTDDHAGPSDEATYLLQPSGGRWVRVTDLSVCTNGSVPVAILRCLPLQGVLRKARVWCSPARNGAQAVPVRLNLHRSGPNRSPLEFTVSNRQPTRRDGMWRLRSPR
jgi:hypothetical protein